MATMVWQPVSTWDFYAATSYLKGEKSLLASYMRTPLLQIMGVMPEFDGDELTWYEGDSAFQTTTCSAIASAGATSVTVAALVCRVGSVLLIESERLLVTAVTSSTKALTVTRGFDGTSAAAHASGSTVRVVGNAQSEGFDFTNSYSIKPVEVTNYTQIWSESYKLTNSQMMTAQNDGGDVNTREMTAALMKHNLNRSLSLFSMSTTSKAASGVVGHAKGLPGFITTNVYTSQTTAIGGDGSTDTISWDVFNTFAGKMKEDDGSEKAIVVGGFTAVNAVRVAMKKASIDPIIISGDGNAVGGVFFNGGITEHGQSFVIIHDPTLDKLGTSGTLYWLDAGQPLESGIYWAPKRGRALVEATINNLGDYVLKSYTTEGTWVVLNEDTHGILTGITGGA